MASFTDRPISAPRPGGHRDLLEKRVAAEATEAAPHASSRRLQSGSRARNMPLAKSGVDATPAASSASVARAAWLAKMQGQAAATAESPPVATGALAAKQPRRGARPATTRD